MANIIKQLKDSNGNNIYPIAYAQGGAKMDLLWTNPSPTSSFASQSVSLDLSSYVLFIIRYKATTTATYSFSSVVVKGVANQYVFAVSDYIYYRQISSITNQGIEFLGGYKTSTFGGTASSNNTCGIPIEIYGIKMSYIVPTVVNGLQYVEV